jgi:hypothetical protein
MKTLACMGLSHIGKLEILVYYFSPSNLWRWLCFYVTATIGWTKTAVVWPRPTIFRSADNFSSVLYVILKVEVIFSSFFLGNSGGGFGLMIMPVVALMAHTGL